MAKFEPLIIGFLCNSCSYAGADLAGAGRLRYPVNFRAIRVRCSGCVDPTFVLQALANGAEGVLIAGCHPGDCHWGGGNMDAQRRYHLLLKLLDGVGVERERVRLAWIAAAEGHLFARTVDEFTRQVRALGPLRRTGGKENGREA